MEQNRKLRLLVTTSCPNKCPLCCNNSWNFDELPVVNRWNYNEGTAGLFDGKSMRLNLFPDIKKALPDNINLSKWQIKEIEWIKDCPVPKGEDVSEL